MVCIHVDVNQRLPRPCVCIQYTTQEEEEAEVVAYVEVIVKSEVSPVFMICLHRLLPEL